MLEGGGRRHLDVVRGREGESPVMSGPCWCWLVLCLTYHPRVSAGAFEKLLIKNLLTNYNHLERPVASENDSVPLEFNIL